MPFYQDGKYQAFYIGDMHPVKIMDGNDVIVQAKPLELTGTALAFADTYNDTVQGLTVFGKSEQVQTSANNNLCPSFDYNKWVLTNGAYLQDGWIYLPNATSQAYINIPWWQKASYFFSRLTVQSDYYDTGTAWVHVMANYRLNGTALKANGYAYVIDSAVEQRKGTQLGQTSNPDSYGQAIAQADNIQFIVTRSADYARQPYRFKDVYFGTVYTTLTDPHLAFIPNSPSPDYPSPIVSVGDTNGVTMTATDGADKSASATRSVILRSLPDGTKDTWEPYALVDGVMRSRKTQRVGVISSYNGESIAGNYMSTTGSLTTGAAVHYALATPIVTLGDPVTLPTYPGYTHLDAGGAELTATCRVVDAI